jgi:integrase
MKERRRRQATPSKWKATRTANLKLYVPSGVYFAHARINGKLIRQSLETTTFTIAQLRLGDLLREERAKAERCTPDVGGKITMGQAIELYRQEVDCDVRTKDSSKRYRHETIKALLKTWPHLEDLDARKITETQCQEWAARFSKDASPTRYNNTLGTLRKVFEIVVNRGYRYTNPAARLKKKRVLTRPLELPTGQQFFELVKEIRTAGGSKSEACADFVAFLGFTGVRKGEAARVEWGDVNFKRREITIKGDPKTGTKNWEYRTIPMIPAAEELLVALRRKGPAEAAMPVCRVREAQKALNRACSRLKISRLTHHSMRDLFATACVENQVSIATVAAWLGHKDGGALALKRYVHPRRSVGRDMAARVVFG